MKKVLHILLCAVLLMSAGIITACNPDEPPVSDPPLKIVYLGDSICEGILGPSPLYDRESYCYYALLGRSNEYEYYNRSVSGHKTANLLNVISTPDNGATITQSLIKDADVISISIIGNDFLLEGIGFMLNEAANSEDGHSKKADGIIAESNVVFGNVMAKLKELNPTARIFIQTVYNPFHEATTLVGDDYAAELASIGITPDMYRAKGMPLLAQLNGVITGYLAEHPDAFTVIDVCKAFNDVYEADEDAGKALIYPDDVHPSNLGHALIAELYQAKFEELGIATASKALSNFKDIRVDQIERMFSGSVDASAVKASINAAASINQVNSVYFAAIDGKLPDYKGIGYASDYVAAGAYYMPADTVYRVSACEAFFNDVHFLINTDKSHITLTKDGRIKIRLEFEDFAIQAINLALVSGMIDFSALDINLAIRQYVDGLFPGFSIQSVETDLDLLSTIGVSIQGLDYENPSIQELLTSLKTDGTIPDGFKLPAGMTLAIEIESKYCLVNVSSPSSEEYVAVYVGGYNKGGQPFFIMTSAANSDGTKNIFGRIEVMQMYLEGTTAPEKDD